MRRKKSLLVRIGVPALLIAVAAAIGLFAWNKADAAKAERNDRACFLSGKTELLMSMDMNAFREEKPFDKAFIDMMTPHHEGAIRMAKIVRDSTKDQEIRDLANMIVEAQEREVSQMKDIYAQYFGSFETSSPAAEHSVH